MRDEDGTGFDPEYPSGAWVGFYQHGGQNHRQDMDLVFREGRLTGTGNDDVGRFTVRGGYDRDTRRVWWTKTYPGSHSVGYEGYREVKGIWGLWEIPPHARDGFHIWPRDEGDEGERKREGASEPLVAGG